MLRQVCTTSLPLMVYNPADVFDAGYFSQCAQAGALPVLDTELMADDTVLGHIDELAKSGFLFGIRISAARENIFSYINDQVIRNCDAVVISYDHIDELSRFSPAKCPYTLIVEVTDIDINHILESIDPNALILRGYEAPGRGSRYTSFILLQWYAEKSRFPFFVHGGVGYFTAAGMFAAGASGLVLDDQLFLAEEAPVSDEVRTLLMKLEESDSLSIADGTGIRRRFFSKLGTKVVKEMKKKADSGYYADNSGTLYDEVRRNYLPVDKSNGDPMQRLFYLGQDAIFARYFIKDTKKTGEIIQNFFKRINEELSLIDRFDPMVEGSVMAREHGTRFPIVQGPMANISDSIEFAQKVYDGGALPFFAMGSLPPDLAEGLITGGNESVKSYGAGMIGVLAFNKFLPEHMEIVKKNKAPFALFAAGNPSIVKELEASGTKTYLHTPSMSMLENAISTGCRRFIFEGTEAGGHVGNLSSMVLWELALEMVYSLPDSQVKEIRLLFAGGVGSVHGSHFISGMTSSTAMRGCGIGVQVATSYLFTKEILETSALTKVYQDVMCRENETILLGETVGLPARTVASPFSRHIHENEVHRVSENISLTERKELFEHDNTGSLLIGAKAFHLDFSEPGKVKKISADEKEQYEKGNFMAGDILAVDDKQITISEIHERIISRKELMFRTLGEMEILFGNTGTIRDEIAIIGMGCIYPDAMNPDEFWQNIISKRYSITEMSGDRFKPIYYDKDKKAEDKTYTKLAGHVRDYVFDNKKYGYSDTEADGMSRSQKMILDAAMNAVQDAGYAVNGKKLPPKRTAVIIASCLTNEMNSDLQLKYYYPELLYHLEQVDDFKSLNDNEKQKLRDDLKKGLAQGHFSDFPEGASIHIEAARVASHLGVEGVNYTIDAACASSLAALDAGRKELLSGLHDVAVIGGLNTNLSPEAFAGFCKMGALSAEGSFPFDERANGFILGEGAGVVVIKRMKDALRDGDRIYAVIKGIGSSSDGKGKAIAAPNPEGQKFALERCFAGMYSDIAMSDIDYIEAHGTSTLMGDLAEIETLKKLYGGNSSNIGLSSVKSQIGHLLGGAGLAGLIKAVQAVRNKTLPPNGRYEKLSGRFDLKDSGLYIIKDTSQWQTKNDAPRLAAISSFGFGGINYHCVIGEITDSYKPVQRAELFVPGTDRNDRRIVISGMGVVLPGIKNADEYWNILESGKSVLKEVPAARYHGENYEKEKDENYRLPKILAGILDESFIDIKKFRMPPATLKSVDRTHFIGLECTRQALEQSGLSGKLEKGNNLAVIIGIMNGEKMLENIIRTRIPLINGIILESGAVDKKKLTAITEKLSVSLKERFHINNEDTVPGLLSNIASGRIANFYGCNGANYILDANSASSAVAMHLAYMGLRSGEYECAITGGIDSNMTPGSLMTMKRSGHLASGQCRIFDAESDGVNPAEGGTLFIMTTYRNAMEKGMPVLAELDNIGLHGQVPGKITAAAESSYTEAISSAYDRAQVTRRQVGYLDVFGYAQPSHDRAEYNASDGIYANGVMFGSSKAELGDYRSANTAVTMAKLMLMNTRKGILPGTGYISNKSFINTDSHLKPVKSAMDINDRPVRYFAANIFGTGGVHGHAIVGTLPMSLTGETKPAVKPVPVPKQVPAADYTGTGGAMVTALLSGQGAQHAGMMKELYNSNKLIKDTLDRGETIFKTGRGYSILDLMFGDNPAINSTENTQPAIFLSTAAVYNVLSENGFNPRYYIGHSLGECSALYCSGILNFDDAMKLILTRSGLMKEAAEKVAGEIMVVFRTWKETADLIGKSGIKDIYVTNKNSDAQTVVAGSAAGIGEFTKHLKTANIVFRKLPLSGAFHTPLFSSASEGLRRYLAAVKFNNVDYTRVISNVTARPYPQDEAAVKELLSKQVISPVEFIESIVYVCGNGASSFMEAGPSNLLTNLLKDIKAGITSANAAVDPKKGEVQSLELARGILKKEITSTKETQMTERKVHQAIPAFSVKPEKSAELPSEVHLNGDEGFKNFLKERKSDVERILYDEYKKYSHVKAMEELEKFDFYTGPIVIAGASIGLPGKSHRIFEDDNFECILRGENRIELLSLEDRRKQVAKRIVRVNKKSDGSATYQEIKNEDEVIHLAGQLGYFDKLEYGIEFDNDKGDAVAIAAGIEALRDAGIPLVPQYRKTSTGGRLFNGYGLPEEMQDTTGIIRTSVFMGFNSLIEEVRRFTMYEKVTEPYKEFENIYYYIMENVKDPEIKRQLTDWFFRLKKQAAEGEYVFGKDFPFMLGYIGAAQFAQLIKAKGPNMQSNAACASLTQGICVAEDWIRTGRCERVIVIGSEITDPERLGEWLYAIFLALGAGTVKKNIFDAAKPFDADRNGTIIGCGAAAVILERGDVIRKRGRAGQAEVLGTFVGNSAFHGTRLDVTHIAEVMKKAVAKIEKRHGLNKDEYTKSMLFMSHETYTPAIGGSSIAEVDAIKGAYPGHYKNIVITNTKGFTGHTLGAGVEDAVMIKALQLGMAPPIANLSKIPPEFSDLNFSKGGKKDYNYGVHFAAGFGSQFALLFAKRIEELPADNPDYMNWLKHASGYDNPELCLLNKTLCVKVQEGVMPKQAAPVPAEKKPAAAISRLPEMKQVQITAAPSAQVSAAALGNKIKDVIANLTGYTIDMLEDDLDLEADLGIDTVKQVEIFGRISAEFALDVPEDLKLSDMNTIAKLIKYIASKVKVSDMAQPVQAAPSAQVSAAVLGNKIKDVIANLTGYTIDMLEDDLDLEADLGIDTVKQVEIFGRISAGFALDVPEDLKLSDMNTIAKLIKYIASKVKVSDMAQPVQAAPSAQVSAAALGNKIKDVIANLTGYTIDMLEDDLDLEADLGIDTVKQVEIFGRISAEFALDVPEDLKLSDMNTIAKLIKYIASKVKVSDISQPVQSAVTFQVNAAPPAGDTGAIKGQIKSVIADLTGYSVDMLEDGLDLEADLGIDTVKQVEIFGRISAEFALDVPEDLKLSDMNTIEKLVNYIASKVTVSVPAQTAAKSTTPSGGDTGMIKIQIKTVIADLTGYSVDMLEDGLDLEADLGIDTVKQVEIFGRISAQFSLDVPEDLKLSDMNTIEKLVNYIASKVTVSAPVQTAGKSAVPAGSDTGAIKIQIKTVIADLTGYSVDMLEDALDLEADLGIDTVKQVEIFGRISAQFSLDVPEDLKLTDMNTIEKLVNYIASKTAGSVPGQEVAQAIPSAEVTEPVHDDWVHRFTISYTGLDDVKDSGSNFKGKTFLISSDSSGFTEKIAERIKSRGGKVFTIGSGNSDCVVDMTDPAAVEKAVTSFSKKHGDINSFIHLSPIDYVLSGTFTTDKCIESSIKSFFMIMKNLHEMFRKKESIVAALSFNSVVFPYGEGLGEIYPVFAGVSGMLKTINKEFKDATVKVIDFSTDDPKKDMDATADIFIKELLSGDRRVEVGYRDGKRFGLMLHDGFAIKGESLVGNGSTLAVTGGAGGITFEILARMVKDFSDLKLIVLDRIDIDSVEKEFLADNVTEQSVITALKKKMPGAKPLEVKNAAGLVMRARKAVSNVEALKKLGAKVDYHSIDVNSAESVAAALKKYKKIDGILHAAGMEESQILEKMTFDSFNRVFNVKGYGVLNLLSALEGIEYKFFAAFSSVAARFGNEGQTNYSGANDMLSKTLFREKALHKNRVYKVCDWTAWEGAGMAMNETVHKVLKDRGMTFLPLESGIQFFLDELCDRDAVEAVFTGIDKSFDHDGLLPGNESAGTSSGRGIAPFLDTALKTGQDAKTFSRVLELKRDLFLNDHSREGTPLFLGATGIETMAEAAAEVAGKDKILTEMRDFYIPYSIKILKGRPKEIIIGAEKDKNSPDAIKCSITSQFKNPKGVAVGDPTLHYEGTYLFSGKQAEQPVIEIPKASRVETDGDFRQIIYHPERLFMGGVFHTVHDIHYFDGKLLVCTMKHAPERDFFTGVPYPEFIVDVVLIDAMFQTGGIFEMLTTSDIILPSKISKMNFYRSPEKDREYLCFTRKIASGEEANTFSLTLADRDGRVYMDIDRFEMVKVTKVPKENRIDSMFRIKG